MDNNAGFWEHLEVLRRSILRVLGAMLLLFAVAFVVVPYIFDNIILYAAHDVQVININVTTQFLTHISTSFWLAFVGTFPYMIYEAWRFVAPALYNGEKRPVRFAFTLGTLMFYAGCTVGYGVVFPVTFKFLANYQLGNNIINSISLDSYMETLTAMVFIMGVMFELPLLTWLLSRLGILNKELLKRYRRHAIVALLVVAAIITPTGDPFTLMLVALPLYLLYELGIILSEK